MPDKVILGYTGGVAQENTDTCVKALMASVTSGVNVLSWSFVQMLESKNATQGPEFRSITGGVWNPPFNYDCVKQVQQQTKQLESTIGKTIHLASVGGWNAPHPTLSFTASEWKAEWEDWNKRNGIDFDGLDWDVEGVNAMGSPDNTIPVPMLQLMGNLSMELQSAGYLVTMAPPEVLVLVEEQGRVPCFLYDHSITSSSFSLS